LPFKACPYAFTFFAALVDCATEYPHFQKIYPLLLLLLCLFVEDFVRIARTYGCCLNNEASPLDIMLSAITASYIFITRMYS